MSTRLVLLLIPFALASCQRSAGYNASEPQERPQVLGSEDIKNTSFTEWQSPEFAKLAYLRATGKFLGSAKSAQGDAYDICSSASFLKLIRNHLDEALNAQAAVVDSTLSEGAEAHQTHCVDNISSELFAESKAAFSLFATKLEGEKQAAVDNQRDLADYCIAAHHLANMRHSPYSLTVEQSSQLYALLASKEDSISQLCPFEVRQNSRSN